ncbi:hypothetical protein K8T06_15030 [bacterium]|nr:hypothetical protein [bacterium]
MHLKFPNAKLPDMTYSKQKIQFTKIQNIKFTSLTSRVIRKKNTEISNRIHRFLSDQTPRTATEYLLALNDFFQILDTLIKPIDHLLKISKNESLRQEYLTTKQLHAELTMKLLNHDSFSSFVLNPEKPHTKKLYQRFQKSMKTQSSIHGLHLNQSKKSKIQQLHLSISTLQSLFRTRVTLAAADFVTANKILLTENSRKNRKKVWRQRATANIHGDKNTRDIVEQQLKDRLNLAQTLGFESYADLMAQHRTAGSVDAIEDFLQQTASYILPFARQTIRLITQFAEKNKRHKYSLKPWDMKFWTEKFINAEFFSDEKPKEKPVSDHYFELDHSLKAIMNILGELFGIQFKEQSGVPTWHSDVRVYDWYDKSGYLMGRQYMDLLSRPGTKSIGAWKSTLLHGSSNYTNPQLPVCSLQCNFSPAEPGNSVLLSWDQIRTLFHEFGHCLHENCCCLELSSLGGTQVDRDILEFPSSFVELFSRHPAILARVGRHYQSGKPMPCEEIDKLLQIENFLRPLNMLRRLKLAMFDFYLHKRAITKIADIHDLYLDTEKKIGLIEIPDDSWPETSFNHIFAGDYAVGYYGYLYALVYAHDALEPFNNRSDPLDPNLGKRFRNMILSAGNSKPMDQLLMDFLGRPLNPAAFFSSLS